MTKEAEFKEHVEEFGEECVGRAFTALTPQLLVDQIESMTGCDFTGFYLVWDGYPDVVSICDKYSQEFMEILLEEDTIGHINFNFEPFNLDPRTIQGTLLDILHSKEELGELCEYLDTCHDLFDLGYIDSIQEQVILDIMAEASALTLWAIHKFAHTGHLDYEYTFDQYVKMLEDKVDL
jgi:hypothetical protein